MIPWPVYTSAPRNMNSGTELCGLSVGFGCGFVLHDGSVTTQRKANVCVAWINSPPKCNLTQSKVLVHSGLWGSDAFFN